MLVTEITRWANTIFVRERMLVRERALGEWSWEPSWAREELGVGPQRDWVQSSFGVDMEKKGLGDEISFGPNFGAKTS
jgi:hypothetical protein